MYKRNVSLDLLRIVCAFSIVMTHITSNLIYQHTFNSTRYNALLFINSILHFAVPIFFMISGNLIIKKNYNYKKIIKKISFLFSLYIVFGLIEAFAKNSFTNFNIDIKTLILEVFNNNSYRWFLLSLISLYLISPILCKIKDDDKLYIYFLSIIFIFNFVLNFSKLSEIQFISNFNKNIGMSSNFFTTLFYYMLGYKLDCFIFNVNSKKRVLNILSIIIFIISSIFISILTYSYTVKQSSLYTIILNLNSIPILISSIALFIFFTISFEKKENIIISHIAKLTLYIYLSHMIFIYIFINNDSSFMIKCIQIYVSTILCSVIMYFIEYKIKNILKNKKP